MTSIRVDRVFRLAAAAVILAGIGGCAMSIDYHQPALPLEYGADMVVVASVHDQRPYVLSGEKKPGSVGAAKPGPGGPHDVSTLSGQPLAVDVLQTVTDTLIEAGYTVVPVRITFCESLEDAEKKMKEIGADRLMLITLLDWWSDYRGAYQSIPARSTMYVEVVLTVYGPDLEVIEEVGVYRQRELRPDRAPWVTVPRAYEEVLIELLNHPEVRAALTP